ncbi:hypothetical protein GOODEAATRI_031407, partial [Goodea atripinnis]
VCPAAIFDLFLHHQHRENKIEPIVFVTKETDKTGGSSHGKDFLHPVSAMQELKVINLLSWKPGISECFRRANRALFYGISCLLAATRCHRTHQHGGSGTVGFTREPRQFGTGSGGRFGCGSGLPGLSHRAGHGGFRKDHLRSGLRCAFVSAEADGSSPLPEFCSICDQPGPCRARGSISCQHRDTVNYKEVMKQYSLGPNGGIVTSLNLFATRFDQVTFCRPDPGAGLSTDRWTRSRIRSSCRWKLVKPTN